MKNLLIYWRTGYEFIKEEKRLDKMEDNLKKFESFYRLLNTWVEMKQEGKNLAEYFEYNNINTIANLFIVAKLAIFFNRIKGC